MGIKDMYPEKASFKVGDKANIEISFEGLKRDKEYLLRLEVYKLNVKISSNTINIKADEKVKKIEIDYLPLVEDMMGYGVEAELYEDMQLISTLSTSFDVLKLWKCAPRYGFLSDFSIEDKDDEEDVSEMNKFHINVVQFYDWMYRHHDLIPSTNDFVDPLNRKLSIDVVKEKIKYCKNYGMKALAYGAVYGAGPEFFKVNKDMALYDNAGNPIGFGGFLYVMDLSSKNKWRGHIIKEFEKALELGFDGIHMDQYGFPKEAISIMNENIEIRKLRDDFPDFINEVKISLMKKNKDACIVFNAVNNWPIDSVAKSEEDCVYIEVWPPNDTYQDLYNIISNAKKYSPYKQVVLAAYIKSFSEGAGIPIEYAQNTALMTMAVIFASGAFHLIIGEKAGILNDQYFPKHRNLNDKNYIRELRNYFDFIVRYEELLYNFNMIDNTMAQTGGINGEYTFSGAIFSPKAEAGKVWTIIKEQPGYKIINLLNFTGIENMNWNETKEKKPEVIKEIEVTALIVEEVEGVFLASPDFLTQRSIKLDFEYVPHEQGRALRFTVPELKIWDLVYVVVKQFVEVKNNEKNDEKLPYSHHG